MSGQGSLSEVQGGCEHEQLGNALPKRRQRRKWVFLADKSGNPRFTNSCEPKPELIEGFYFL